MIDLSVGYMAIIDNMNSINTIEWTGKSLRLLDQRKLPEAEIYLEISDPEGVAVAIKDMVVRGAPAIGVAGAFGVALAASKCVGLDISTCTQYIRNIAISIGDSRPTAVNLRSSVDRMLSILDKAGPSDHLYDLLLEEAIYIKDETFASDLRMAEFGSDIIPEGANVLTHCNTGPLATSGYGTAIGVIRRAWEIGKIKQVFATETRPWLQGARLTTWELKRLGIPFTLVVDSAAGHLMARGEVDCVVVGADRITANGDVANKIGTLGLAIMSNKLGIPFFVVAPRTTLDLASKNGDAIDIEERDPSEITDFMGKRITPYGINVRNLSFDVTPNNYIDAIVTDLGVASKPYIGSLRGLVGNG
jgi:methylthioribose-1-phosphate isomerase